MSVAALAGNMAVLGTHHDVLVDGGLVHAPGQQLVLAQAGAILGGAGIAGTKGDVTGGVLIEEGAVEQRAAAVDGAGRRHQRHFADAPCALVGVQQPAQKLRALVCTVLHDAAILEGDMEALDELAVEDVGLGAVDDAVHLVLVGCGEDLFGGDVGQEDHALFTDAGSTLPGSLVGDADGQIRAVAALEMDALEVEGVHLVLQAGQTVEVGLPLVDGVAARHAADIENELPELLDGRCLVQLREHLFCPRGAGHGGDGPLDAVVHGVLAPRSHELALTGVHPADFRAVQTGVDFRVIGEDMQHADPALTLGVVEIAAQLPGLEIAQGFLAAQFHPAAGNVVVAPIHQHVTGAGLVGTAHAQTGQRCGLEAAVDDKGLARLGIDTHPDDEIGIFFQKNSKVFHGISFLPCKPRRCIFYLTV